jgi:hypothetical protein
VFSVKNDKPARWIASSSLSVAIAIAAVLAVTPPVKAEDPIVKLVSAASGKCLQPIDQSHNRGDAIVQQTCNRRRIAMDCPYSLRHQGSSDQPGERPLHGCPRQGRRRNTHPTVALQPNQQRGLGLRHHTRRARCFGVSNSSSMNAWYRQPCQAEASRCHRE